MDNVRIVRINLDQITDISKNADIRNSLPPYFPISKELFYICIFVVTLAMTMFMFNDFIIIAILFIAIFFLPKSIICALQGGICFNRLLYDRLAIYFKDGTIINIFITATQEYLEIKRYFLINKGINISKAKTELIVFSKRKTNLHKVSFHKFKSAPRPAAESEQGAILLRLFNQLPKFNAAFRVSVVASKAVKIHRFFHILVAPLALFVSLHEHIAALRVLAVAG